MESFTADDIWVVRERLPLPSDVKIERITSVGWIRNQLYRFTFDKDWINVKRVKGGWLQLCIGWKLVNIESGE